MPCNWRGSAPTRDSSGPRLAPTAAAASAASRPEECSAHRKRDGLSAVQIAFDFATSLLGAPNEAVHDALRLAGDCAHTFSARDHPRFPARRPADATMPELYVSNTGNDSNAGTEQVLNSVGTGARRTRVNWGCRPPFERSVALSTLAAPSVVHHARSSSTQADTHSTRPSRSPR